MLEQDIVRMLMAKRRISQVKLAEMMGYNAQGSIASMLKAGRRMKVSTLCEVMELLDCEVVIRDKRDGQEFEIRSEEE